VVRRGCVVAGRLGARGRWLGLVTVTGGKGLELGVCAAPPESWL